MNLTVTSRTVNNGGDIVGVASGNTTHFMVKLLVT
jgi:hypothetical protein